MMNTMKRVTLIALLTLVASASTLSPAQAQFNRPNNNRYERADDLRDRIQDYLNRVDRQADLFARGMDRDMDSSRLDGKNREDTINQLAKEIRQYARNARNNFDRGQSARSDVQRLLEATDRMDTFMRRTRINLSRTTVDNWTALRNDMQKLRDFADRANRSNNGRNNTWWR
jgi:DNA repair exonuclease SbcCD ATPase subunit